MTAKKSDFPGDKTEQERRKNLDQDQIDELELAGGVEGGMQAGSGGGPGEKDADEARKGGSRQPPRRTDDHP
jgi:hypothetical protein